MSALTQIRRYLADEYDTLRILRRRRNEIKKFKDPRRKEIYETIRLTDEQKRQIDALYLNHYGEKIPYTWHRHFTAFTGKFDPAYLPELLYIPEFEYFMNLERDYIRVLEDKNLLPFLAYGGVKTPTAYLSATRGIFRDAEMKEITRTQAEDLLGNIGEVFIKPTVESGSGKGCHLACFAQGRDMKTGISAEEMLRSLGSDFVVQERLKCHESLARFYAGSVNTFRIITYRWRDKVYHMPVILRIGQGGGYLDNAHAGGMFIAIDDDGTLHKTAFTEFRQAYEKHPDSGLVFEGERIVLFPKVLNAAHTMCARMPYFGCINWDFTLDETGEPVLIEANLYGGSIWMSEMAHGCGPFGERMPEILEWMKLIKHTRASERYRYRYGNMQY